MSRENYGIELTGVDGKRNVLVNPGAFSYMEAGDKTTTIYFADGTAVEVMESLAIIEQIGGKVGCFKVVRR